MMMKRSIILLIGIIIISCRFQKTSDYEVDSMSRVYPYKINIPESLLNNEEILLSSVADSIKYISIEKRPESIIRTFFFFEITDQDFFINSPTGILRFDLEGNYLNNIGRIGRGPAEYLQGSPFTIDIKRKLVYIYWDASTGELLTYDLSGNYKGSSLFTDSLSFEDFAYLSDDKFAILPKYIGTGSDNMILCGLFDMDGKLLRSISHSARGIPSNFYRTDFTIGLLNKLSYFNNEVISLCDFEDTIYKINNVKIYPAFILEWGDLTRPSYKEKYFKLNYLASLYKKKYATVGSKLFETDDKVFFIVENLAKYFIVEYNKTTASSRSMPCSSEGGIGFINDLDGGMPFFPDWSNRAGDIWIQKIDALDFKKSHSKKLITKSRTIDLSTKDKLTRFVEKTEIDDNPILKVIYLKKN